MITTIFTILSIVFAFAMIFLYAFAYLLNDEDVTKFTRNLGHGCLVIFLFFLIAQLYYGTLIYTGRKEAKSFIVNEAQMRYDLDNTYDKAQVDPKYKFFWDKKVAEYNKCVNNFNKFRDYQKFSVEIDIIGEEDLPQYIPSSHF